MNIWDGSVGQIVWENIAMYITLSSLKWIIYIILYVTLHTHRQPWPPSTGSNIFTFAHLVCKFVWCSCMYMCLYVCGWACQHVVQLYVYSCIVQRIMLNVCIQLLWPIYWGRIFQLNPGHIYSASLVSHPVHSEPMPWSGITNWPRCPLSK